MILILIICIMLLFSCSTNVADGAGSETINSIVVGSLVDLNGNPASNTLVLLIPSDHNPVLNQPLPDSMKDTTDNAGNYQFNMPPKGTYNIEAIHAAQGSRLLLKGIAVSNVEDTITLPLGTLKQPGSIVVYLAEALDTVNRYVYIKGTTRAVKISKEWIRSDYEISLIIDSVPEATIENVYFFKTDDPANQQLFIDTVVVISNRATETDGFTFNTNYTAENSGLPHNTVYDIDIDPLFKLWFATGDGVGNLDYIRASTARSSVNIWTVFNTDNSDLPSNMVLNIDCSSSGKQIFSTLGGYASLTGNTWNTYTTGNSNISSNFILEVDLDSDYNSWVCTMDKGLLKFDGTSWTVYDTGNSYIPSNTVMTVLVDENDTIWCATPLGVWKSKDSSESFVSTSNSGMISDDSYCMLIDRNRHKWFGREGGASRYDEVNKQWTHYMSQHSAVFTDSVLTIVEDDKGILWFGSASGLTKYDGAVWHDFTGDRYNYLKDKGIRAIAFDSYGNTWFGTTNSGVIAFGPTIK